MERLRSISDKPAASRTTANLVSADQLSADDLFSDTALPSELSCLRQLDKDISLTPSRRETSAIDRFCGGSSILSNAALRSGE